MRLGVAISRDPPTRGSGALRIEDLLDVQIEVGVEFARAMLPAGALLDLRPGTNVPMMTTMGEPALLKAGGSVLARGECGALGKRGAMIVNADKVKD